MSAENTQFKWYIIKCPSSSEHKLIETLKENLQKLNSINDLREFFIPNESVEKKLGKKSVMANYIFAEINLTEKFQKALTQVKYASIMLDHNLNPVEIEQEKIEELKFNKEQEKNKKEKALVFGEKIVVLDESFLNFEGTVEKIDADKKIATVNIPVLGTSVRLELPFDLIKRINN